MTIGQVAYERWASWSGADIPWDLLTPNARSAWEATARAVADWIEQHDGCYVTGD